ncbi:DMT family transporter [Thermaurantiacus sp.]
MPDRRSAIQFLAVVLIWGTTWFVIKDQLASVPVTWSVAYRFAIGGAALLAWCRIRGMPIAVPASALPFLTALGLMQFVLNFNFVYRSELYIPSGIPAVAFALLMVPNAILARLFLGRRLTRHFLAGAALGVVGVGLLFGQQLALPDNRDETVRGLALVTAAIISASIANVMQASPAAARFPALAGLGWAMLIGAALNALWALVAVGPPAWDSRPSYTAGLLFLAVAASALAFALYFDLIRRIGPAEAAWTGVPIPILAMAISTALEGYRWTLLAAAGAVLALAGLIIALRSPPPRPHAASR